MWLDIICHFNKSVHCEEEVHPDWGFSDFHSIHGSEREVFDGLNSISKVWGLVSGRISHVTQSWWYLEMIIILCRISPLGGADPQSELILQISHFPILIDSQAANSTTVQTNKVHCFMPTSSCSDVMRSVHCFLFIILVFLSKQVLPCSTSLRSLIFFSDFGHISDITRSKWPLLKFV